MYKIILFFAIINLNWCCNTYKAGNLYLLDYPIETNLSYDIRKQYLDIMTNSPIYKVPQKWIHYNKLIDINPNNTWRIYLKNDPEEMYLVTMGSNFVLEDVFNPKIIDYDWVSEKERMSDSQKLRVIKRCQKEILDKIEQMAKQDGCPDSILFFAPKFVDGKWTVPAKWKASGRSL